MTANPHPGGDVPGPTGLPDRYRRVLRLVVRSFIERGEPVSSLWLTRHNGLAISSATVRNVFARLEEWGYLRQPHTSAGRVPTDLAYRCYVDDLLQRARRPGRPARDVVTRLPSASTIDEVLASASHELSRVSHHVGFAVPPATEAATLREIQFVGLEGTRVLVVVISGAGQISHKVVELEEPATAGDLRHSAAYLNREFAGLPLQEIRDTIAERLADERILYDALRGRALRLASSSLDEIDAPTLIFIQGAFSLLEDAPEQRAPLSRTTLRALFEMIEEKHRLVRLLTAYIDGPGVTVVIGSEHKAPDLQDFSLVAASYRDGGRIGTIGVLGPTRMHYSRAISAVEGMSEALSRYFL